MYSTIYDETCNHEAQLQCTAESNLIEDVTLASCSSFLDRPTETKEDMNLSTVKRILNPAHPLLTYGTFSKKTKHTMGCLWMNGRVKLWFSVMSRQVQPF